MEHEIVAQLTDVRRFGRLGPVLSRVVPMLRKVRVSRRAYGLEFRSAPRGLRFLGRGTCRFAFLDEQSGLVFKVPASMFGECPDEMSAAYSEQMFFNEAANLPLVPQDELRSAGARVADTAYVTVAGLLLVIQEYVLARADVRPSDAMLYRISRVSNRISDVRPANTCIDKGGFVVLFDCIPSWRLATAVA